MEGGEMRIKFTLRLSLFRVREKKVAVRLPSKAFEGQVACCCSTAKVCRECDFNDDFPPIFLSMQLLSESLLALE